MAYIRKTRDTFELWTNYGQGWEHECTEMSRRELRAQIKCYRENCPGVALKTRIRREKIEEVSSCPSIT